MADSSKTVTHRTSEEGSSKLELPTTQKRDSSVTLKPKDSPKAETASADIAEQPTEISKKPPFADPNLNTFTTSSEIARTLIGRELLHFRVEEFVGGGGMGAVCRGIDTTLGRTVAIKVLSRDHIDEDMIRRFRHEALSAARLDHSGIPHVYFVGEQDGWYFIVLICLSLTWTVCWWPGKRPCFPCI